MSGYPSRIVCLSPETAETLHALGAGDRVAGVAGGTVRPDGARHQPRVSTARTAHFDTIARLEPDLILAFSDRQADLAAALVRRGYPVVVFNQRTVAGILQMIRMLGGLVGEASRAIHLCGNLQQGFSAIRLGASLLPRRPRVFFEEWPDPLIAGSGWVQELIEIAGGDPLRPAPSADGPAPYAVDAAAVARADPQAIVASWRGRKVRTHRIRCRAGWENLSAVREGHVYAMRSTCILRPGPIALTEGLKQLHAIVRRAVGVPLEPALAPNERFS